MDLDAIMQEARCWMDRANEVHATPDDVLKILAVIMGQLLHEHATDSNAAGHTLVMHNRAAIDFYALQRRRQLH